jgi:hypothetical protein
VIARRNHRANGESLIAQGQSQQQKCGVFLHALALQQAFIVSHVRKNPSPKNSKSILLWAPIFEPPLVTSGYVVFRAHIYIAAKMPDSGTKANEKDVLLFSIEILPAGVEAL